MDFEYSLSNNFSDKRDTCQNNKIWNICQKMWICAETEKKIGKNMEIQFFWQYNGKDGSWTIRYTMSLTGI